MAKKAAPKAAESKPEPKAAAPKAAEAKAAPAKKSAAKAAPAPATPAPAKKAATKGEVYTKLAEQTNLSKKQVASVFEAMTEEIGRELGKKGPGLFVIPGLLKLKVVRKEATKEKQSVNPFTKEPMTVKAKPARNVIKAVPLKGLKDLV